MYMKNGELVVFKEGLYPDEEDAVYRILEINGDRCILEFENSNLLIQPQSIAMMSEIILFEGKEYNESKMAF